MSLFLQALVGAIVWTFANLLYVDLKRKGVRSVARIVAFWVGLPGTWLSLVLVRQARQPRFRTPEDDDEALLAEVREDRARRLAREQAPGAERPGSGDVPDRRECGRDPTGNIDTN